MVYSYRIRDLNTGLISSKKFMSIRSIWYPFITYNCCELCSMALLTLVHHCAGDLEAVKLANFSVAQKGSSGREKMAKASAGQETENINDLIK